MKRLIVFVVIFFGLTFAVLFIFYQKQKNCKYFFKEDGKNLRCGLTHDSTEGTSLNYLGKIDKFYTKGETGYVSVSFGSFKNSFRLGKLGVEYIVLYKSATTEGPESLDFNDLQLLNSDLISDANAKYKGKYTTFIITKSETADKMIGKINDALKLAEDNQRIETLNYSLDYWNKCPKSLKKLTDRLNNNNFVAAIGHNIENIFSTEYRNCSPKISTWVILK